MEVVLVDGRAGYCCGRCVCCCACECCNDGNEVSFCIGGINKWSTLLLFLRRRWHFCMYDYEDACAWGDRFPKSLFFFIRSGKAKERKEGVGGQTQTRQQKITKESHTQDNITNHNQGVSHLVSCSPSRATRDTHTWTCPPPFARDAEKELPPSPRRRQQN